MVLRSSARSGIPNEVFLGIDAAHSDMCRFSGVAGQDSYDIVGPNIREMADNARQRYAMAVAQQPEAQPPQIPAPPVAQQGGNRLG